IRGKLRAAAAPARPCLPLPGWRALPAPSSPNGCDCTLFEGVRRERPLISPCSYGLIVVYTITILRYTKKIQLHLFRALTKRFALGGRACQEQRRLRFLFARNWTASNR